MEVFKADAGGDPKGPPSGALADLEVNQRSPVVIDVAYPLEEASVTKCAEIASQAVDTWLAWTGDDAHDLRPGMQVTSTYARDTKLRSNNYGLLVDLYGDLFGEQGANIAAGDAGPLDEAYVGGAS